jgi:hypothetical protein
MLTWERIMEGLAPHPMHRCIVDERWCVVVSEAPNFPWSVHDWRALGTGPMVMMNAPSAQDARRLALEWIDAQR